VLLSLIGLLMALPHVYHRWIMTVFSLLILASVVKIIFGSKREDYRDHTAVTVWNWTFGWLIPAYSTSDYGAKFFVRARDATTGEMRLHTTEALLCMFVLEVVDVLFAFDSMPAVATVTNNPIVMVTCSLMAVAGLRQFYFLLNALEHKLSRLDTAVIGLLIYISLKVIVHEWCGFHIDMWSNLAIVGVFLLFGVVWSLVSPKKADDGDGSGGSSPDETVKPSAAAVAPETVRA
jgi:tellurite resistance protein TerC